MLQRAIASFLPVWGVAQAAVEYETLGSVRTSTKVDLAISSAIYVGSFVPAVAPVAWGVGVMYGGIRLMAGDTIDNWIDGN